MVLIITLKTEMRYVVNMIVEGEEQVKRFGKKRNSNVLCPPHNDDLNFSIICKALFNC